MKSCCFIGHRDCNLEKEIFNSIKKLISDGVTQFYSGGMGDFDKKCEKAVKELGGKIIFVPYNTKQIKPSDELWYDEIININGEKAYAKFDIPKRNKWLVDNCNICLCYVYKSGGAAKTFSYAQKMKKPIINLYIGDNN